MNAGPLSTVSLAFNQTSHRRVVEVLRAAHLDLIADEYEGQLPDPTPEPERDVVVRDAHGVHWARTEDGRNWSTRAADQTGSPWSWLTGHRGPLRLFGPEPSAERVEELVYRFWQTHATPKLDELREFAAALLGGAS